ncbi:hypothetical protein GCM10023188_19260 [Pontibacter saemangeumensis]|uniref:SpoIIAA-like n=1 Tax=Pontibacter saemangeumensis TaxID=1084525 RepID=A0ABP8LM91_9BACT
MIIFKNGFIRLDYDPASDILSFAMPSVNDVVMPEMRRCLVTVVEHVRNYDVKRVLLDARETAIGVGQEIYVPVIAEFYGSLATTRLQKVARLVTPGSQRERIIHGIFEGIHFPMEVRPFAEAAPAVEWLQAKP